MDTFKNKSKTVQFIFSGEKVKQYIFYFVNLKKSFCGECKYILVFKLFNCYFKLIYVIIVSFLIMNMLSAAYP